MLGLSTGRGIQGTVHGSYWSRLHSALVFLAKFIAEWRGQRAPAGHKHSPEHLQRVLSCWVKSQPFNFSLHPAHPHRIGKEPPFSLVFF